MFLKRGANQKQFLLSISATLQVKNSIYSSSIQSVIIYYLLNRLLTELPERYQRLHLWMILKTLQTDLYNCSLNCCIPIFYKRHGTGKCLIRVEGPLCLNNGPCSPQLVVADNMTMALPYPCLQPIYCEIWNLKCL